MRRSKQHRCIGIDFSGAMDAGQRLWITVAWWSGASRCLTVESVRSACEELACDPSPADTFPALVDFLKSNHDAIVAVDAPLSLPLPVMTSGWNQTVLASPSRFPAPESLRQELGETKRQTDRETRTPMAPGNLRLYRQTYAAIVHVLHPLLTARAARVFPMMSIRPDQPTLIEACPASAIKHAASCDQLTLAPYKGRTSGHIEQRRRIFNWLHTQINLDLSPKEQRIILEDQGGDALDSLICTALAAGALSEFGQPQSEIHSREGRVFYRLPDETPVVAASVGST
ncbi:MAG: DUF429 domain-containing protein [Phycisphaeraceae bacterium]